MFSSLELVLIKKKKNYNMGATNFIFLTVKELCALHRCHLMEIMSPTWEVLVPDPKVHHQKVPLSPNWKYAST
jgi:hypothetical protein